MRSKFLLSAASLFILSISFTAVVSAQDIERPERNESGSIAPESIKEKTVQLPSNPVVFISEEATKIKASSNSGGQILGIKNKADVFTKSISINGILGIAPTSEALESQAQALYREHANRLAARDQILFADEFLKAFAIANSTKLQANLRDNLQTLLDEKLINRNGYQETLRKKFGFTRQEAQTVVKSF